MHVVLVELLPSRSHEQKTKYVEEVARLTSDILKCSVESIDVMFVEIPATD